MALQEVVVDGVATITMDNPPVNALGAADTYALAGLLDGYRTREDVRVVVLTARGRSPLNESSRQLRRAPGGPRGALRAAARSASL